MTGVAPQLLFAPFAWALFTDENMPFFRGAHEYAVLLLDPEIGRSTSERLRGPQVRRQAKLFDPFVPSRSVSLRKRQLVDGCKDGTTDGWDRESRDEADVALAIRDGYDEDRWPSKKAKERLLLAAPGIGTKSRQSVAIVFGATSAHPDLPIKVSSG